MKTKLLAMMPYVIVLMINFYALPLLITNTGLAMLAMLAVMPLITFICAVIYGARQGFNLLLALICGVLFAPTIFIFYNTTAWVYIVAYTVIAVVGNGIGSVFYKKR